MDSYRPLNTDEIKALQTINVAAVASKDNIGLLYRRIDKDYAAKLQAACDTLREAVEAIIDQSPDEDQRIAIKRRMDHLKLQFGFVRQRPETYLVLSEEDAQTLIAPCLEKCDLECPCIEYGDGGDRTVNKALVKGCETRKALRRLSVSPIGLGSECPYQMLLGRKD